MNLHVDHVAENKIAIRLFDRFLTADFYSDAICNDRQECNSWEIYRMEKINEFEDRGNIPCELLQTGSREPEIHFTVVGLFGGPWSLPAVNRHLARSLEASNSGCCGIVSYNEVSDPDLESMMSRRASGRINVVIHQRYPVKPPAPRGDLTVSYLFWEESRVPAPMIEILNHYDAVFVSAEFIKRALIESGLMRPIFVIGFSPNVAEFLSINAFRETVRQERAFTFLHVSSCFPVKGLDVLLLAYQKAFTRSDNVRLLIKSYPSNLNQADALLLDFKQRFPSAADVVLLNQHIGEQELLNLFSEADVMVLPTRGEGFNIPAAEAVAAGIPLIVTGYGGHMDFLVPGSARFIKFRLVPSRYRVADGTSLWAEPDVDDLCAAMQEARNGQLTLNVEARKKVLASLNCATWVARIKDAVDELIRFSVTREHE